MYDTNTFYCIHTSFSVYYPFKIYTEQNFLYTVCIYNAMARLVFRIILLADAVANIVEAVRKRERASFMALLYTLLFIAY